MYQRQHLAALILDVRRLQSTAREFAVVRALLAACCRPPPGN